MMTSVTLAEKAVICTFALTAPTHIIFRVCPRWNLQILTVIRGAARDAKWQDLRILRDVKDATVMCVC